MGQTAEIVGRPRVNDDEITLRVKVTTDEKRPAMLLTADDFRVIRDGKTLEPRSWKSPTETIPPPAWIVVLIDFSGSMQQLDGNGTTKLQGAIEATRQFIEETSSRGGDTRVAILPFGDPGPGCLNPPKKVTKKEIESKFFSASDIKQQNLLEYLASQTPCASTNIYDPLEQAIRLLGDRENPNFYKVIDTPEDAPQDDSEPEARLSVILLSDGYHNKPNEERDFQKLISLLKQNSHIVVHTLGYGLTEEQLGQKYQLGRPATRADVNKSVPEAEFVDGKRLREIAATTGGIAEFSGQADEIAEALQLFLDSLLGEYELVFRDEEAERGSKHEVSVKVRLNNQEITTPPQSYTIQVFGRSLPLPTRLTMMALVLFLVGVGGVLPFWRWSLWLKHEAEEDF